MMNRQTAIFGGGCFWCLDAVFREVAGVLKVDCGYSGGALEAPDYHAVCGGQTGHAEVVRIVFDAEVVDYRQLLEIFFVIHDPTSRNRQGNDVGTQYRSVIFVLDEGQRACAEALIGELEADAVHTDPIVTEVLDAPHFWPAEPYHQDYFSHHALQPYCRFVVAPKLERFRRHFPTRQRAS